MARTLALFDFDGTLAPGDSIVSFVRFARRRGAMGRGDFLAVLGCTVKYLLRGMTDAQIKTRSLRFLHALSPEERESLAADFVKEALLPKVCAAGRAAVERHRRSGHVTLLVSASTENYMHLVSDALGFDAVLCTPLEADLSVTRNCKGGEKARRVQMWLEENGLEADWGASWAYGDSKSDLPLLRLCGHPVLVNPKKALKRALPGAEEVHWH